MGKFTRYSEAEKEFMKQMYAELTICEIATALDRSPGGIATYANRILKLLSKQERYKWSKKLSNKLLSLAPIMTNKELSKILKKNSQQIDNKIRWLRAQIRKKPKKEWTKKEKLFLEPRENTGRIGYPGNMLGGIYSKKHLKIFIEAGKKNRFKKGNHKNNKYVPVGTVVWKCSDISTRRKIYYYMVKIGDEPFASRFNWEFLHRLVWFQEYGDIPKGQMIKFKDGNSKNVTLDNLIMISRADNARLNAGHRTLSNSYVARILLKESIQMKLPRTEETCKMVDYIIETYPDVISLKRQQILLNRQLKNNGTKKQPKNEI